jgi:hypothetical protein
MAEARNMAIDESADVRSEMKDASEVSNQLGNNQHFLMPHIRKPFAG